MNRNTRMLLNIVTGIAVTATAALVFLPAAYAEPGVVTGNVNVRSGPGTNYAVVDTAHRGVSVDVQQCRGSWCYINQRSGTDGWVSANYLSAGGSPVNPSQPSISFGFNIGPGGPSVNIGVGNPNPPVVRPPVVTPVYNEVCFFERTRRRGASLCLESGDSIRDLDDWADQISSIDNPDGLQVQVCSEINFRSCRTYTTSANSLDDFDDYIVSIRVR